MALRRRVGDEQLVHHAIAQSLPDGLGTLDEEPPRPVAARAAQQLAGCDDAGGAFGAGRVGIGRRGAGTLAGRVQAAESFAGWAGTFALATSTSAANAVSSVTAMSASTLRSTSTPAALRPWMNRL
jgi:hypothetical protein